MRTTVLTGAKLFAVCLMAFAARPQAAPLTLDFSTYFGGPGGDHIRDVVTDAQGYIYFTGGADAAGYPVTAGAFDTTHNGDIDVVVTKLDPTGQNVVWSTFIGGPSLDRAYAIEVDPQGYVYVGGRAGTGFPTTAGAIQTQFRGGAAGGPYPSQDKFVAKLTPDGSSLVYCTYFGAYDSAGTPIRDIDIDAAGNCYIGTSTGTGNYNQTILNAFQNGFDSTHSALNDGVVAKISPDGTQCLWATYLGGSGTEWGECSVRTDSAGNVYYLTVTNSTDIPTTSGAYDRTFNGGFDFYVAKVNANGTLGWATYLGGSDMEHVETHELELDSLGNVIVASGTKSSNYPTTPGAYDRTHNGNGGSGTGDRTNYPGDLCISKISADGSQLLASTLVGGRYGESGEGVGIDAQDNIYLTGAVYSDNFPTTAGAFQSNLAGSVGNGNADGFLIMLSPDLSQLLYSTYMGTASYDALRSATAGANGEVLIGSATGASNWPTQNAIQATLQGPGDCTLVKFLTSSSPPSDTTPPSIAITSPTNGSTYATSSTPISIGGSASDNVGVALVDWSNTGTGATGTASGTGPWSATIALASGANDITFTAWDAAGNSASDSLTVTYTPSSDSDGDGLPDSWETQYFGNLNQTASGDPDSDSLSNLAEYTNGTDPTNPDTDGDGLLDGAEVNTHGTDPLNPDSDGDGHSDGQEIAQGTNPLDPLSFPGSGSGSGGGSGSNGACGATGFEILAVFALATFRRRRRRMIERPSSCAGSSFCCSDRTP